MLRIQNRSKRTRQSGPILATSPPHAQAREGPDRSSKAAESARNRHDGLQRAGCGRSGSRFLPKVLRAGVYSIFAWGCFRDFCLGPRRDAMVAGPQSCRRRGHRSIARADAPRSHRFTMTDDKDKGKSQPARNSRQDRLKLALRENLKRRKSQARGRSDVAAAPRDDADASPHDELGKKPGE